MLYSVKKIVIFVMMRVLFTYILNQLWIPFDIVSCIVGTFGFSFLGAIEEQNSTESENAYFLLSSA